MKLHLCLFTAMLVLLTSGCTPTKPGPDWDNLDFVGVHCDANANDPACDAKKNDLSIIGKGGKSK